MDRQAGVVDSFLPFLPKDGQFQKTGPEELTVELLDGQLFCIVGQCHVQVLEGCVDLLGFRAEPGERRYRVCSPKAFSLAPIINASGRSVLRLSSIRDGLQAVQGCQAAFQGIFSHADAGPEDIPGCWVVRQPLRDCRVVEAGPKWTAVAGELAPLQSSVIFVCGSRKTGKSTFCRYLCNRLLNYHRQVALVDFDCGQSELTVPGSLAFELLNEPILVPPFARIAARPSYSRFVGAVSLSESPKQYLGACLAVMEKCRLACPTGTPIVINMLGWISGLGFTCLAHLLQAIRPSHVLGFGDQQVDDFVSRALYVDSGLNGSRPYKQGEPVAIAYMPHIASTSPPRIQPADARSLSFWSYFHHNSATGRYDFDTPICDRQPFAIARSSLHIHFCYPPPSKAGFWPSVNCAVVALARSTSAKPGQVSSAYYEGIECEVIGVGLVRGVDPIRGLLYVYCPLPLDAVCPANVLIVGQQALPPGLFTSGGRFEGPYFSFQSNFDTAGFNPRKVRHNIQRGPAANRQ